MKDVAPYERPREKLARVGVGSLGENELLALVLGVGSRGSDALELANCLLHVVGGVHGLVRSDFDALCRVSGVGAAKAAQIVAAVELGRRTLICRAADRPRLRTPRDIAAHLLPQYGALPVEHFGIVMLDTKHRVIRIRIVAIGSLDTTVVHPREVFREAASGSAAAIVLFHNHPSGDPPPSPAHLLPRSRMVQPGWVRGMKAWVTWILPD